MNESFKELLQINRGHFRLESGLHGDVWFDLELAFIRPTLLRPFTDRLAGLLEEYDLAIVCGALVGGAFVAYSIAERLGIHFVYTERHVTALDGTKFEVSYRLPQSVRSAVAGRRIGIIDDVINAGSAVTKTYRELKQHGADPVVIASILTVGDMARGQPSEEYPPIVALEHLESNLWKPSNSPLCKSGTPIVDPYCEERQ